MFFTKSKQNLEAIEAYRNELESVKDEFAGFKKKIESDLGSIKKDFKELITLLQESPEEDEEKAENQSGGREGPVKEERTPAKIINEILGQNELDEMKTEVASIFEKVVTIARQTEETAKALAGFRDTTYAEMKSLKNGLENTRRDINNKIKYAISRLRT